MATDTRDPTRFPPLDGRAAIPERKRAAKMIRSAHAHARGCTARFFGRLGDFGWLGDVGPGLVFSALPVWTGAGR